MCVSLFYVIDTGSTGSRARHHVTSWGVPIYIPITLSSDAGYADLCALSFIYCGEYEPKQVYGVKLDFVSERTIKEDHVMLLHRPATRRCLPPRHLPRRLCKGPARAQSTRTWPPRKLSVYGMLAAIAQGEALSSSPCLNTSTQ